MTTPLLYYKILNIKNTHSQRLHVLLRMQSKLTTNNTGKTDAAKIPLCISFLAELVQSPTMDGPNVPPASPARARREKRAVPPCSILADVRRDKNKGFENFVWQI